MNDLPQARGTAPSWSPCRRQSPRVTGDEGSLRGKSPLASLSGPRTTGDHTPHARRGVITESLAAAMARGRRPVPFRTWKLRPGTAMVLHPAGCGRVARRRTNTCTGGPGDRPHANPRTPLPYPHKTSNRLSRQRPEAHATGTRPECCLLRCCNRGIAMQLRPPHASTRIHTQVMTSPNNQN